MDTSAHNDILVQCFDRVLDEIGANDEAEVFVARVAEEYMMALVRKAHIPLKYLESLRDDISTEVLDMLRVRTYGYVSLAEYLTKRRRPNKSGTGS